MLLSEPPPTQFDLRFSILGFPVRVHPLFFLMPLVLGGGLLRGDDLGNTGVNFLILTAVFFVSILVHELGHALAMKYYGESSYIILYWMGGLAVPDLGRWNAGRTRARTPYSQVAISAAGPVAGLLLGMLFILILLWMGGRVFWDSVLVFPVPLPDLSKTAYAENPAVFVLMASGMWSCFFWNFLNLLPVFPLDGGQIARSIFAVKDPWNGIRNSLILSLLTAIALVIWAITGRHTFAAFFFGMMAFESYQLLQMGGGGGRFGGRPW